MNIVWENKKTRRVFRSTNSPIKRPTALSATDLLEECGKNRQECDTQVGINQKVYELSREVENTLIFV